MDISTLSAGAYAVDITPPLALGLLTSSVKGLYAPFESVRLPLHTRVLVLKSDDELVAIVSMDLLGLTDTSVAGWNKFKEKLSDIIPPEKIILTCTHTHSAPESVAFSDLYLSDLYKDWLNHIQVQIKRAIKQAVQKLQRCHIFYKTAVLNGYSLQRRIRTPAGIIMSDSVQPITTELMELEPVDRRVASLCFQNEDGEAIATLVHAVCHPVHEMCLPYISSEFPGEMCIALEKSGQHGMPIFLNGAAGDTNPPTVSEGPQYARGHGQALAKLAQDRSGYQKMPAGKFGFIRREIQLTTRPEANITNKSDAVARLSALRIGDLAFLFLPGEPFVETAFQIETASPFTHTLIAGFCENTIGYIPTDKAHEEGGYEVGPGKWAFLPQGTDGLIVSAALEMLNLLYQSN